MIDREPATFLYPATGTAHMHSSAHKDSRWFSFHDHCLSWDRNWHLEAMTHAFSWWVEGTDPWGMKPASHETGDESSSYSLRVAAWNVPRPNYEQYLPVPFV